MKQNYKNTENQSKLKPLEKTQKTILFIKKENPFNRLLLHLSYLILALVVILSGTQMTTAQTCNAYYDYVADGGDDNFIHFLDASNGDVISWSWDFGDGATSTEQNPSHLYSFHGDYFVGLYIETSDSCMDFYEQWITVGPCRAGFQWYADGLDVSFFDSSSLSTNNWSWDFGDGNTSAQQHPIHTYTASGDYNVCLTILTDKSCEDTYCDSVVVKNNSISSCSASGLVNDASCYGACDGDASAGSSGTAPFTYSWSTGETTQLISNLCAGRYDCTVTDADGCMDGFTVTVNEPAEVVASYTYSKSKVKGKVTYHFSDASSGNPDAWSWDFGDGSTSTEQNPDHQFSADGSYNVCLTASANSCEDIYCEIIEVGGGSKGGGKKTRNMIAEYHDDTFLGEMAPEVGNIYPNPVTKAAYIEINIENYSTIDVMVFNSIGQQVYNVIESLNFGEQQIELQLAHLPKGMYFVRMLINDSEPITKKFIKN